MDDFYEELKSIILEDLMRFELKDDELISKVIFYNLSEIVLERYFDELITDSAHVNKNILKSVYPYIFKNSVLQTYLISNGARLKVKNIIYKLEDIDDVLGIMYERSMPEDKKRDIGQFYTRSNLVIEHMLNMVGYNDESVLNKRIIDPAAGSGLILIEASRRIRKVMESSSYEAKEILNNIVNKLYGVDLDSLACYITELNLLIENRKLIVEAYLKDNNFVMPRFNVFKNDFILAPEDDTGITFEIKSLSGNFISGFDFIVSNPPYVTMYGRRSRNMTQEKREYYNRKYDFVVKKDGNNKFNTVMFFIERAIKMLRDEQQLCFIIDAAFLESAYADIRRYILNTCKVNVIMVGLKEFSDVVSGQLVICISKCDNEKTRNNNTVNWIEGISGESFTIKQKHWNDENNEYKFFKPFNDCEKNIISTLEKNKRLSYYFPKKSLRTCCALTGKTEKFIVSSEEFLRGDKEVIFPYIEGAKGISMKFGSISAGRYFKYDYELQQSICEKFRIELTKKGVKNKKRIALGDRDAYCSPKVFIRQCASEIICTYTEKNFAANNSIYILTNKLDTIEGKMFLKYICGVLNSNLISYYARIKRIIRMGNGKTPQIKLSDLKTIPVKAAPTKLYNEVVEIVDNLLESGGNDIKLIKRLNLIVYKIYGIEDNEMQYIENTIKTW